MNAYEAGNALLEKERGESGSYLSISDEELFAAMDIDRPGLEKVKSAVEAGDYDAAYGAWGEYWAKRQSPKYYVDAETYAPGIKRDFPELEKIIIARADELWSDDFGHATYKPRRAGRTFDWASKSPDSAYIGFHYFWCIRELARAFLLTGDARYPAMFREIVCSWWDALPEIASEGGGVRVIWNNGLGSSLRAVFMMDNYCLMRGRPEFTTELHRKILKIFLGHARYMYDTHMKKYSHSNFQTSQSCWMVTAGVLLPEFRESEKWLEIGIRRIGERIEQNYDADGAQVEQCPQYHLAGMRDITRAILLLHVNELTDFSRDEAVWRKLESIYDYPVRIAHPTGHTALFNSGVYTTEWQAFLPIGMQLFDSEFQAWAAQRFIKPGFIPIAKNISEYILFMDGAWVQTLRGAHGGKPPEFTNDLMQDSGIAILRSGWDKDAFSFVFDFNRQPWGGHAYAGRLSFDLFANGVALVVNPGSTISYAMPVYRNWCYQTIGHNTVMVNNRSQEKPFNAELLAWHEGKKAVFVSALTRTYEKSEGIIHQRSIVSVTGEYYFILDRLTGGKGGTPLAWLLHSPQELVRRGDGSVTTPEGKPGLLIAPDTVTSKSSDPEFGEGYAAVPVEYHEGYKPLDAWREDVPYLRFNAEIDGESGGQTYGVLLVPFKQTAPEVKVITEREGSSSRLEVHAVRIDWKDHSDFLTVDYRKDKPEFSITRKDLGGKEMWSE